jgi:hypothetical protein
MAKKRATPAAALAVQQAGEAFVASKYSIADALELIKRIKDDAQLTQVANYAKAVKALMGELEKDKTEIIEPIRKGLDKLYAKHRELKRPLEAAHSKAKKLIADYHDRQNAKAIKQAEKKAVKLEAKGEKGQAQAVVEAAKTINHAPTVKGVTVAEKWEFEVEDPALVPIEFGDIELRPIDDKVLRRLAKLKEKAPKIPGVRFFAKTQIKI